MPKLYKGLLIYIIHTVICLEHKLLALSLVGMFYFIITFYVVLNHSNRVICGVKTMLICQVKKCNLQITFGYVIVHSLLEHS